MNDDAPHADPPPLSLSQRVLERAARWYVFIFLNVYGLGKIAGGQFYRQGRLPEDVAQTLLGEASAFDLAWTFMGHSFAYILFIGLAEVLGAWLLLWDRTKLLGVAVLLPVMVNILVFDVLFLDKYGALASATIYTVLLLVILWCNKEKVAQALLALTPPASPARPPLRQRAKGIVATLVVMGLLFAFDQLLVNLLGHGEGVMKVLAIGATGFIGPRVVRRLVAQGHEVAMLHRGQTHAVLPEGVLQVLGDRHALLDVWPQVQRFGPEVVLDVVPYTERQAQGLVEAVRGLARRLVAVSSADVYRNYDGFRGKATAPPDPVPLAEGAPLRETRYPYRGYGLPQPWADDYDKIPVEHAVLHAPDLPGTVLRLPAVYGPGDPQHRLRPYLQRMDHGRPAVLLAEAHAGWRWTRGYVENVAAAIALAVTEDRAAGRVYNVGEAPAPTERAWVQQIGAAAGWAGEVVVLPETRLPAHLQQPFDFRYDLATDTRRIREELGYVEPVGRRQALEQTIAWERAQPADSDPPDYRAEDAALAARKG